MESDSADRCSCELPKSEGWTVECLHCGAWRHGNCSDIKGELSSDVEGDFKTIQSYCGPCFLKLKSTKKCLLSNCEHQAKSQSEFCCPEHASEFFEFKLRQCLQTSDMETLEMLETKIKQHKGLSSVQMTGRKALHGPLRQSLPPTIPPAAFPPIKVTPMYTLPSEDKLDPAAFSRFRNAIQLREESNKCGFSTSYFALARGEVDIEIVDECENPARGCQYHKKWPTMIEARMKHALLCDQERVVPNTSWITGSKQIIEPGTVRIHSALKMETKHFIPYVWDNTDSEYFLDM